VGLGRPLYEYQKEGTYNGCARGVSTHSVGVILPTSCGATRMDMTMTSVSPGEPASNCVMGTLGRSSQLSWKNEKPIDKSGVMML
jgi:hypothetical protein